MPLAVPTQIKLFLSFAMQRTRLSGRLPFPFPLRYSFHLSSPGLSIDCPVLKQASPLFLGNTIHFWLLSSITICETACSLNANGILNERQLPSAFFTCKGLNAP